MIAYLGHVTHRLFPFEALGRGVEHVTVYKEAADA